MNGAITKYEERLPGGILRGFGWLINFAGCLVFVEVDPEVGLALVGMHGDRGKDGKTRKQAIPASSITRRDDDAALHAATNYYAVRQSEIAAERAAKKARKVS